MQGARRGTRSWDSRIMPWVEGRRQTAEPPGDPRNPSFNPFCQQILIIGLFTQECVNFSLPATSCVACNRFFSPIFGSRGSPPDLKCGPFPNFFSDLSLQTSRRTWKRSFPSCRQRTSDASTSASPPQHQEWGLWGQLLMLHPLTLCPLTYVPGSHDKALPCLSTPQGLLVRVPAALALTSEP